MNKKRVSLRSENPIIENIRPKSGNKSPGRKVHLLAEIGFHTFPHFSLDKQLGTP